LDKQVSGSIMPEWIKGTIESLGYFGIILLMIIENVFPPIPSEIIMPLAGFLSTQGEFSFLGVAIAGTIGSVLGALLLYYAGRKVGADRLKRWADSYGRWLMLSSEDIGRAQAWFHRRGAVAVFVCRLVPGLRSMISIPAGIERMNLSRYILCARNRCVGDNLGVSRPRLRAKLRNGEQLSRPTELHGAERVFGLLHSVCGKTSTPLRIMNAV
jgi:membrane protein DedA with SNARE-associated domain